MSVMSKSRGRIKLILEIISIDPDEIKAAARKYLEKKHPNCETDILFSIGGRWCHWSQEIDGLKYIILNHDLYQLEEEEYFCDNHYYYVNIKNKNGWIEFNFSSHDNLDEVLEKALLNRKKYI